MSYNSKVSILDGLNSATPISRRTDPRAQMHERLPGAIQPFLTWLTANPAPGETVKPRSPVGFVASALLLVAVGVLLISLAFYIPLAAGCISLIIGLVLTSSGLGVFQVVVFHHCSHGTVFARRETNVTVGRLISAILLFKHFDVYRKEHMLHHNAKKLLTEEDEFADFVFAMCGLEASLPKRELWRRVGINLISPLFHAKFLKRRVLAAWRSHDSVHNAVGMSVWAALLLISIYTGTAFIFLVAWVLPVTILLQIATVFRILCEHRFPEDAFTAARDRDFVAAASTGVFPGTAPPGERLRSLGGALRWAAWWGDMLTVQLFVRVFVLVGDAPCHDYHHRHPATRRWTSYIQARQVDVDAPQNVGVYSDSWGLFRTVDAMLESLARTPRVAGV